MPSIPVVLSQWLIVSWSVGTGLDGVGWGDHVAVLASPSGLGNVPHNAWPEDWLCTSSCPRPGGLHGALGGCPALSCQVWLFCLTSWGLHPVLTGRASMGGKVWCWVRGFFHQWGIQLSGGWIYPVIVGCCLQDYRASQNKLCIAIASPIWLLLHQISSGRNISWGLKMSRAIAILSWKGETVISSSKVCSIFYNIENVLSSTQELDSR